MTVPIFIVFSALMLGVFLLTLWVIKRGAAVAIYMLPNLFVVMGLTVLSVVLGLRTDHRLLALGFTLIAAVLAALSYRRVLRLSK